MTEVTTQLPPRLSYRLTRDGIARVTDTPREAFIAPLRAFQSIDDTGYSPTYQKRWRVEPMATCEQGN